MKSFTLYGEGQDVTNIEMRRVYTFDQSLLDNIHGVGLVDKR